MKPKTQRAWEWYAYGSINPVNVNALCGDQSTVEREFPNSDRTVLVVPEDAVTKCRHRDSGEELCGWCIDCGAHRNWDTGRWRRPRVLRVGRVKK